MYLTFRILWQSYPRGWFPSHPTRSKVSTTTSYNVEETVALQTDTRRKKLWTSEKKQANLF